VYGYQDGLPVHRQSPNSNHLTVTQMGVEYRDHLIIKPRCHPILTSILHTERIAHSPPC